MSVFLWSRGGSLFLTCPPLVLSYWVVSRVFLFLRLGGGSLGVTLGCPVAFSLLRGLFCGFVVWFGLLSRCSALCSRCASRLRRIPFIRVFLSWSSTSSCSRIGVFVRPNSRVPKNWVWRLTGKTCHQTLDLLFEGQQPVATYSRCL